MNTNGYQILSKIRGGFVSISIFLCITLLTIAVIEGGARWWFKKLKWGDPVYMMAYTDDVIKKLYNTDDPNFYREVLKEGWGTNIKVLYSPFVEYVHEPSTGNHVNILENGVRKTRLDGREGSFDNDAYQIFVFGGSTTFGMGVSDMETIPAYLQQMFSENSARDVIVYNFGVVGSYSTQERIYFEKFLNAGARPDMTVFIDGLNDMGICDIPDVTGFSKKIEKFANGSSRKTFGQTLAERSNVVKLMRYYSENKNLGDGPFTLCENEEKVEKVIARLDSNRRMVNAVSEEFGIKALFVQQPVPFFRFPDSERAFPLTMNKINDPNNMRIYGFERIRELQLNNQLFSKNTIWLMDLRIDGNEYIDNVHYSPHYNKKIASEIFKSLSDRIANEINSEN